MLYCQINRVSAKSGNSGKSGGFYFHSGKIKEKRKIFLKNQVVLVKF